jgi:hypothetical protein
MRSRLDLAWPILGCPYRSSACNLHPGKRRGIRIRSVRTRTTPPNNEGLIPHVGYGLDAEAEEDSPPIGATQFVTFHCPSWYPYETQLSFPSTDAGRAYWTSASPVVVVTFRTWIPVIRIECSGTPRWCSISARSALSSPSTSVELTWAVVRHGAPCILRISATVPVKKALDQAVAAARSPAVPLLVGEPCEVCKLAPVLQAAQSAVRLPTAIQPLTLATDQSLHSIGRPVLGYRAVGVRPIRGERCLIRHSWRLPMSIRRQNRTEHPRHR